MQRLLSFPAAQSPLFLKTYEGLTEKQLSIIASTIMDNFFSLNPLYVFKKRRLCAAGKLKTLCTLNF